VLSLRVLSGPGKSWNLKVTFSWPGKCWNQAWKVMESGLGPGKSWKFGNANRWCDEIFDNFCE